jgi:poly-gamma-glutamate synthesis protein (capsule biosynthesis protein)
MHWGVDFTDYPLLFQMKYAREMIDSGADLILGHHPHNIQGIEKYQNGIIVYSLGDFVFDGSGRDTFIFKCEISKSGIKKHELIPATISNLFQTELLYENEANRLHNKIELLSKAYTNYDKLIAKKVIDKFIGINLDIFVKTRNIHILRNYKSLFMMKRLFFFLVGKTIKKIIPIRST